MGKTRSIVYAWMRSAIGLFLLSILVSVEGTLPSARDLSLGKSLRVKRHDWFAKLSQRKFVLLAPHEVYTEFTVEYTATEECRADFADRKVCPLFPYRIIEVKWISAPACKAPAFNCLKHDRQSLGIILALSPLSRLLEVICSISSS